MLSRCRHPLWDWSSLLTPLTVVSLNPDLNVQDLQSHNSLLSNWKLIRTSPVLRVIFTLLHLSLWTRLLSRDELLSSTGQVLTRPSDATSLCWRSRSVSLRDLLPHKSYLDPCTASASSEDDRGPQVPFPPAFPVGLFWACPSEPSSSFCFFVLVFGRTAGHMGP